MAYIEEVYRKRKGKGYRAIIRRKGLVMKKTFNLKSAAQKWALEEEQKLDMKRDRDPRLAQRTSLKEGFDRYWKMMEVEHSPYFNKPNTRERKRHARNKLEMELGQASLRDITPEVVAQYRDKRLGEDKVGTSSVRNELSLLSIMMTVARVEWGIPIQNPLKDIKRPEPPPARDVSLTEDQARLVLEECLRSGNKKLYPFVLLLMHTGARVSEAASRHIDDVDLKGMTTEIRITKSGKPRTVPITKAVRDALAVIDTQDYFSSRRNISKTKEKRTVRHSSSERRGRAHWTE